MSERPGTAATSMPESGFSLANATQRLSTRARAEFAIGRRHRGGEEDVAARPVARSAGRFLGDFGWALAHGGVTDGARRVGGGRRRGLDDRRRRLDVGGGVVRFGESRSLSDPATIASGLVAAALLTVGGGAVALTGEPGPPAACSPLAGRATVACLGSARQEPVFAPLEQAAAAAGMPPAATGWLTWHHGVGKLGTAHGRDLLPSGQAAGRWNFPPPLCADRLGSGGRRPSGTQPSGYLRGLMLAKEEERAKTAIDRSRLWLNWLCDIGSVFGRC